MFIQTADVTGRVELIDAEMCLPGDNATLRVELGKPVAVEKGTTFALREGSRTIGSGIVLELTE